MSEERWAIPKTWKWVRAGEISEIIGGSTPPSRDTENFQENGIPWLTPSDLTGYEETYISKGKRDLSQKGYNASGAKIMPTGAVLFSSRAPIGYCVIASNPISTNQGFKSLVLMGGVVPDFVRYYLVSAKEYAESISSGTTFKELSGGRMSTMPIPIAPLTEQRRIVAKLDRLLARSRSAREELERIPKLCDRYRQAVLASACSGRLTADWRKQNLNVKPVPGLSEGIEYKQDHKEKTSSDCKDDRNDLADLIVESFNELPIGWCLTTATKACIRVVDCHNKTAPYSNEGIKLIRTSNIRNGALHNGV